MGVQRSVLVITKDHLKIPVDICGEWQAQMVWQLCAPSPSLALGVSPIWLFLSYILL